MSFNGLHVVAGYLGGATKQAWSNSILQQLVWSETFEAAGVSTKCAPDVSHPNGEPVFEITAKTDAWIAVGKSPDSAKDPRIFVAAGTERTIFAKPGDFIAWEPA